MRDLKGAYFALTFVLLLLIAFLPFERFIADFEIPSVGAVAVGSLIVVTALPWLPAIGANRSNLLALKIFMSIALLYVIWLLVAMATMNSDILFRHAKGEFNVLVSVLIATAAIIALRLADRRVLAALLMLVLVVCYLGVLADAAAPNIFNSIKADLYGEFYEAQDRDVAIYGAIRHTFIFFEPSFAGIFITLVCSLLYACFEGRLSLMKWIAFLLLVGLFVYLVRSPTILAGPIAILPKAVERRFRHVRVTIASFLLMGIAMLVLFQGEIVSWLEDLNEQGFSTGARFVAPWRILVTHMDSLLVYGSGLNFIPMEWLPGSAIGSDILYKYAITNSLAEFFIAHGVAFGALIMMLWVRLVRVVFRIDFAEIAVVVVIFWSIIGGVVSIMNWLSIAIMFFVLSTLDSIRQSSQASQANYQSRVPSRPDQYRSRA